MPGENKLNPWERTPDESDDQWLAFEAFRDMAYPEGIAGQFKPRRLRELADRFGWHPTQLTKWGGMNGWHVRAAAFDRHVDALKMKSRVKEIDIVTGQHRRLIANLRIIVENEISKHADMSMQDIAAITTFEKAADVLERVVKLERLVFGSSTENVAHVEASESEVWHLERLTVEELEALETIRRKACGPEPIVVDATAEPG